MSVYPGAQPPAGGSRLLDIDRAKGLAILLVVFGHIVSRGTPPGHEWYSLLKSSIYLFHMPFFIYLSGIVFFHTKADQHWGQTFWRWITARAERLLLPFIAFGVITVLGKLLAAHVMHVDDLPKSLLEGLSTLVVNTSRSPALSIWFMFVIFVYCLITPLLMRLTRGRIWPLLLVSIPLLWVEPPPILYADRLPRFYFFFLLGGIVGRHHQAALAFFGRYHLAFLALFAASFAVVTLDLDRLTNLAIVGTASLPALHALVTRSPLSHSQLLLRLGRYAFVIYLFNTIFIGLAKGVLLWFFSWGGKAFLLVAPLLFLAGVVLPILLKLIVLRRVPVLDRMTN